MTEQERKRDILDLAPKVDESDGNTVTDSVSYREYAG